VLVAMVSWWYWPRGDARFVGKWSAHLMGGAAPEVIMSLRAYGSSIWTYSIRPGLSDYTVWQVDNERLVFGVKESAPIEILIMRTQAWFNALPFALKVGLNENPWDILSVSADRIELVSSGTRYKKREMTMTLYRIPE
jgi:hypothetical protein